jgi:hypothetical protein
LCFSARLGLNVQVYDPMVRYRQVRDAWVGLRLAPQAASSSPPQTANTGMPQNVANLLLAKVRRARAPNAFGRFTPAPPGS